MLEWNGRWRTGKYWMIDHGGAEVELLVLGRWAGGSAPPLSPLCEDNPTTP